MEKKSITISEDDSSDGKKGGSHRGGVNEQNGRYIMSLALFSLPFNILLRAQDTFTFSMACNELCNSIYLNKTIVRLYMRQRLTPSAIWKNQILQKSRP